MYQFRKDVQFMCGFAGYYGAGDFNREEVIDQMGERIAHRGPDSKGSFVDDYVALGFRRLSIIDLEGGSQPIHSADGKHVIIFNGEIYNYQEIRKELIEKHGYRSYSSGIQNLWRKNCFYAPRNVRICNLR